MEQIGIRELRNHTSGAVRRAMSGERLVITIDGVPAAQLGPLNTGEQPLEIPDLIAAGLLIAPRSTAPPTRPSRVRAAPGSPSSTEMLEQDRNL